MLMRSKVIKNKSDGVLDKLSEGIKIIAGIVKRTLGPGGLPVLIERTGQNLEGDPLEPMITKDGVTVANECFHEDELVDIGIQTVKSICNKTNRNAGDGTTTAIVLGEAIFNEAIKSSTKNPQLLKVELDTAIENVLTKLSEISTPVDDLEMVKHVATISANGDEEIGEIIKNAFEAVGSDGVITVDEGHSQETTIDVVQGFQINRGAEGGERFLNNQERTKFEVENALVVMFDGAIRSYADLVPIFKQIQQEFSKLNKQMPPLLVIANEFSGDTMQFLTINKVEGGLNVCAVKSPNVTTVRTAIMDDMAVLLGGKRLGSGNHDLSAATFKVNEDGSFDGDLGFCERVVVDKYTTTFYGGAGSEEDIQDRIMQLEAAKKSAFSEYDTAQIQDRIASLAQGIAKIGVGGKTELEIKEKYHRIEDALNAARAAVEEGVIPGGGITLYKIAEELTQSSNEAERILSKALKAPFLQILDNIGLSLNEVDLTGIMKDGKTYDARNRQIVDALQAGIIDPVKVTKTALENAASISNLLSTCGGLIVYTRGKK